MIDLSELWIIAGPNGSGKTTITHHLVPKDIIVINPDDMAAKLTKSMKNLQDVALTAAREALARRQELIQEYKSFVIETTLTGYGITHMIQEAKAAGYTINLLYVGVENAAVAIRRVSQRVQKGGHNVPIRDIIRRYQRSLQNLSKIIPNIDKGIIIDNTNQKPVLIAEIENGKLHQIKPSRWLENVR